MWGSYELFNVLRKMVCHNKDTTRPTIIIDFMSRASEVKRLKKTNDCFFAKNNELVN